jgi:hypothetical protein
MTMLTVARRLGVSLQSVYGWARRGLFILPEHQIVSRKAARFWTSADDARLRAFMLTRPRRPGRPKGSKNRNATLGQTDSRVSRS